MGAAAPFAPQIFTGVMGVAQYKQQGAIGKFNQSVANRNAAVYEDQAYQMMASNLLDQMAALDEDQRLHISLATTTKLLVENFVLNLRLKGADEVIRNL